MGSAAVVSDQVDWPVGHDTTRALGAGSTRGDPVNRSTTIHCSDVSAEHPNRWEFMVFDNDLSYGTAAESRNGSVNGALPARIAHARDL